MEKRATTGVAIFRMDENRPTSNNEDKSQEIMELNEHIINVTSTCFKKCIIPTVVGKSYFRDDLQKTDALCLQNCLKTLSEAKMEIFGRLVEQMSKIATEHK